MDRNDVEKAWNRFKSTVQRLLIDDDLDDIGGSNDGLVATLQERYGVTRQEAERELDEFHTASPIAGRSQAR